MNEPNMSRPSRTDWARIDAMTDEEIDTSDIPPLTEEFFKNATMRMPTESVADSVNAEEKNTMSSTKVEKIVTRAKLAQQPSDFAYWQTQSYETRLAALEQIRREYHGWRYGAEPRLQRVCAIVKRQ